MQEAWFMVSQTPTARIEWLAEQQLAPEIVLNAKMLLDKYEHFWAVTSASEEELVDIFQDQSHARKLRDEQAAFGDLAYKVLVSVGGQSKFYRCLMV
jgi:hypothetical protein